MSDNNNANLTNVIFISGWGFNAQLWQRLIEILPSSYTTQCLELPPYPSSVTQPNTAMRQAAELLANQLPQSAIIVGWSLGGNLAATYSYLYPKRCQALITVASSPRYLQAPKWPGVSQAQSQRLWQLACQDWHRLLSYFGRLNVYPRKDRQLIQLIQSYLQTSANNKPHLMAYLRLLLQLDERQIWQRIAVPWLHMYADQDAIVEPGQVQYLTAPNQSRRINITQGCHALPLQQPYNLVQYMQKWLTNHG